MRADLPFCDFCGRDSLQFSYQPEGSTRGLKVYLCRHCGLVQSAPRIDRTQKRQRAAVSGERKIQRLAGTTIHDVVSA